MSCLHWALQVTSCSGPPLPENPTEVFAISPQESWLSPALAQLQPQFCSLCCLCAACLPSTNPIPKTSSLVILSCFLGFGSGCAHNIYFLIPAAFCALVSRGGCSGDDKFKETAGRENKEVRRVLLKSPTSGSNLDFETGPDVL